MLIEKTFHTIMQEALQQTDILIRNTFKVAAFEDFCAVLREQGHRFTETLNVDEHGISYYIKPEHHGDYLAILESVTGMNAMRTPGPVYDFVNLEPDVPLFWLHTTPADVCTDQQVSPA
jgi:hypothetical protein